MAYKQVYYGNRHNTSVNLVNITFNKDMEGYYLSAKYRIEDDTSIRDLDIPKIRLRVNPHEVALRESGDFYVDFMADIGFGFLPLNSGGVSNGVYFTETIIEEKTHEMTLDEIEKKLGYKVKIVNKKG